MQRTLTSLTKTYDLVVVGGGLSGTLAAISAARKGLQVALIQNRPVLGGNASSEVKMHICGADCHASRKNARETGILEEILLENRKINDTNSFYLLDIVLWEKVQAEKNITLYLNTHMDAVHLKEDQQTITSVEAIQLTSETRFQFYAPLFVDATGDGTLGFLAGADYLSGEEEQTYFSEDLAPKVATPFTMGSSLQFTSQKLPFPVSFTRPYWAYSYTEEDLKMRNHHNFTNGYWWIEAGGDDRLDTITKSESIRDELYKMLFGVWDHIKNIDEVDTTCYALNWVGSLPGKRESRRFLGDYILTANDLLQQTHFTDAVAYGGWPMDIHVVGGITTFQQAPNKNYYLKDLYTIPYRCLYSRNISNLFIGGRLISASHLAFGSTRVMATCSIIGEAIGLAASLAQKYRLTPRQVGTHIKQLQQLALKNDLYIPDVTNQDELDLAREAKIACSSFIPGYECENVINGTARPYHEKTNQWQACGVNQEWLSLKLPVAKMVKTLNIKFDSNLSQEIMLSLSHDLKESAKRLPSTLVKDFQVIFYHAGNLVKQLDMRDNFVRNFIYTAPKAFLVDEVKIVISKTYGSQNVAIFEVRLYETGLDDVSSF